MDARAKAGLRGPVSVCRTDVTMFVRACSANACDTEPKEQTHWTIARYRPDGRMAEIHQHGSDGREWISSYTYDAAGLLREVETRGPSGSVSKRIYHYDQIGRLLRAVARGADGNENSAQTFDYDDQRNTKTQYFHSMPDRPDSGVSFSIEGTDTAFSARGVTSMTTVYDDRDRPVEAVLHDSQDRPVSRVTLRYDDGRLVEESQTTGVEATLPPEMLAQLNPAQLQTVKTIFGKGGALWKRVHHYDLDGHRVQTIMYLGSRAAERRTMAYDERGDLSEEKTFRTFQELPIDDQGRIVEGGEPSSNETSTSESRFSYQYDEHGNWIERVVSNRSQPDEPFAVRSVERRSLTYYPA